MGASVAAAAVVVGIVADDDGERCSCSLAFLQGSAAGLFSETKVWRISINITYAHKPALQPTDHCPPLHTAIPPIVNLDLHECPVIFQKPSKDGLVITQTSRMASPGMCDQRPQ